MTSQKKPLQKDLETKKPKSDNTVNSKSDQFPIVGIGASAGGLEAMEQFFGNMPPDCGMAFVVIQHLDPDHKGIMPELLQRITKMQVVIVNDRLKIKPNCVYVIPPNKSMSILNGALHLFEPIETRGLRLPIDFFFRSLAEDKQDQGIGIILSGMGSDGSMGVKAIKENGGIVLAQEPSSAKFDSMPRSAIEAVTVDIIAPACELPAKLLRIRKVAISMGEAPELEKDNSSLEKIIILLRIKTGNDFSQYKKNTLYRRVERRMGIHQISKIASYVRYLQENPTEIDILFKELLIGVTNFFRDTELWEHLKESVLPKMFADFPQRHVIRAWVPACSTGEEAFTLAMIFKEAVEKQNKNNNFTFQIFATDLDSGAIEQARKGIYPVNIEADVNPERLARFFIKTDNQYRIISEIREMVVFAPQNIIKDPPFTKLDILSCRNMLIYMSADLQNKLISLFHYSLNANGILILGSAESNSNHKDFFSTINSRLRVYQKLGTIKQDEFINFPTAFAKTTTNNTDKITMAKVPDNIQSITDNLILQQYSPASVLVNFQGDIIYLTGNTGKYLTPAAGKASFNIFTMAREGLRNELPTAFRKAMQNYEIVHLHNVKVGTNGGTLIVNISLQQIENPSAIKGKILIVFSDVPLDKQNIKKNKSEKSDGSPLQIELEQEIQRLAEDLQTTHEEMQTSQEELKSTNEELQSSNEELQSANEELTTSKEEMQSLNEELQTVNVELQSKIDDSLRASNDIRNLLNNSEIATLFLDRDLKIRQFTSHATKIYKLLQSDIGRHFTDLSDKLNYPEMLSDTKEVLRTLLYSEKTISSEDGSFYTIRIMPYCTLDNKIEGLVITFIDVTKAKQLENALNKTHQILKSFIHKVPSVIIGLSANGQIIEFNQEAEEVFERKRIDVIDRNYFELFIPKNLREKVEADMKQLLSESSLNRFENLVKSASGKQLKIEWTAHQLFDDKGLLTGIITIGENITEV